MHHIIGQDTCSRSLAGPLFAAAMNEAVLLFPATHSSAMSSAVHSSNSLPSTPLLSANHKRYMVMDRMRHTAQTLTRHNVDRSLCAQQQLLQSCIFNIMLPAAC